MAQSTTIQPDKLEKIVQKTAKNKLVHGVVLCVERGDAQWMGSAGELATDTPYFIASTTKLYMTAVILMLEEQGAIKLDDRIDQYLPDEVISGLHVLKGVDYSRQLTIRHLLAHTSGLPDYFEGKQGSNPSLLHCLKLLLKTLHFV